MKMEAAHSGIALLRLMYFCFFWQVISSVVSSFFFIFFFFQPSLIWREVDLISFFLVRVVYLLQPDLAWHFF